MASNDDTFYKKVEQGPRRVWISALLTLPNNTLVRVMGRVIHINEVVGDKKRCNSITIDDGNDTLLIDCPGFEMQGSLGETVDCVGYYRCQTTAESTTTNIPATAAASDKNGTKEEEDKGWVQADCIVWKVDAAMEALRWYELSLPERQTVWGYPQNDLTETDVHRIICHAGQGGCGATLDNLCLVLDREPHILQPMIESLQAEGAIYQNRSGVYLPL